MNVSKNITEGRAHIGVIQGDVDAMEESITGAAKEEAEGICFTKTAWSKPLVYVDDGYFGTLHLMREWA